MKTRDLRLNRAVQALTLALTAALVIGAPAGARAAVSSYTATLTGAAEAPPNTSAAIGFAQVDVDPVAHTMNVFVSFEGLEGLVTACHIHAPTATAGTGTAGVASQTPSFTGFPSGVTAGIYDQLFDTSMSSSFSAAFIANSGGTVALAEAALFQFIAEGRAYVNVHSSVYPGGEIRGFLSSPVSEEVSSWGQVKSLYR